MDQDNDDGLEVARFSEQVLARKLYPYQLEIAQAIAASVVGEHGFTFTVMMARQMGKNELSAHLEAWLRSKWPSRWRPSIDPPTIFHEFSAAACLFALAWAYS